ncbi:MAG: hypothetical protein R3F49_24695, partial [Planctomycetota bacterium]
MTSAFALLGALTLVAPSIGQAAAQAAASAQEEVTPLTEADIGLTLFRPQFVDAKMLMRSAIELSEPSVHYLWVNPATLLGELRRRDRYVLIADCIGIQGDEPSRETAAKFLTELDRFLGGDVSGADQAVDESARIAFAPAGSGARNAAAERANRIARSEPQTRTVRLRSVTVDSALALLDAMAATVERQVVRENGTIILRGTVESVGRAEALLREVDRPSPQMTLHISLVQAAESGAGDVDAELAQALGGLMPGKQFREVGRFMTRASVSGATPLELSSTLATAAGMPPPRFEFKAGSRAWDADARVLTLGRAELRIDTPFVQSSATAGAGGNAATVQ